MYYYQILSTVKLPEYFLTYSSQNPLYKGQSVLVTVRNKPVFGIIWAQVPKPDFETKEILEIVNYNFDIWQLEFMRIFAFNTFNHLNNVFEAQSHFMQSLTKANLETLKTIKKNTQKTELGFKTNFVLDIQLTLRIRTIIRTIKSSFFDLQNDHKSLQIQDKMANNPKLPNLRSCHKVTGVSKAQILILFPEKKYLTKLLSEFLALEKINPEFADFEICQYTGTATKQTKACVRDLVLERNNFQIIFGTRASLFLPFSNLLQIILVDEANSMYIQDQGGLYYDTREAVFLLAKTHNCHLDFVSTLPSLRLFGFYEQNWAQLVANYPQKPVNAAINVNIG